MHDVSQPGAVISDAQAPESNSDRQLEEIQSDKSIAIVGIVEETIVRYFETLNAGDFSATAALFAEDGVLYPPFESGISGREAIVTYLEAEAKGMKLFPREGSCATLEEGDREFKIKGKVQTPLFGVNVGWMFVLNSASEILSVGIKLLASPQELLNLKR